MISKALLSSIVRSYREATQADVTTDAINFAYYELLHGRKTALITRIESLYRRAIEEMDIRAYLANKTAPEKKGHDKGGIPGVDYLNADLLEQVLDPDFNQPLKIDTFKLAYESKKLYLVLNCTKHGFVMHRTSVAQAKEGEEQEKKKYQGYCLFCKTVRQSRYKDKIEAIKQFQINYFEYRESLKTQSAS